MCCGSALGLPPLGIKANPHITIDQTLTMELEDME